jgi:hypothetical protein
VTVSFLLFFIVMFDLLGRGLYPKLVSKKTGAAIRSPAKHHGLHDELRRGNVSSASGFALARIAL